MIKRFMDVSISGFGLLAISPLLLPVICLVWLQDKGSPFYVAPRVGQDGIEFQMVKLRSMIKGGDNSGVNSTSNSDSRITPIGHFIRRYKLDELTQLWNVLRGDMSLVGPRPQVKSGVEAYTIKERELLIVKPGITDFASIVFADEGQILEGTDDPDLAYDKLIRPGKSRLGLFYINKMSILVDLNLIYLTLLSIISRKKALIRIQKLIANLGADEDLILISGRNGPLQPGFPPY